MVCVVHVTSSSDFVWELGTRGSSRNLERKGNGLDSNKHKYSIHFKIVVAINFLKKHKYSICFKVIEPFKPVKKNGQT
jgi:hypothetical protein